MATYVAMSQIRVGRAPEEDMVFEAGDVVTGLSKDQMIELWGAGVITEQVEKDTVADERDAKIADLEQELAVMRAEKAAAAVPQGEAPAVEPEPDASADAAAEGTAPGKNASQAAWAEYAVSKGANPDEAAAMSREELIAKYGTEEPTA